jgi:hypothetical protein
MDTHLQQLRCKFLERHYPPQVIDHNFEKAKQKNRRQLIFQARKNKGCDNKIRLIFTHNQSNPPLHKWMREAKKTLVRNQKAKELGDKIQIATKQPRNIQQIVRKSNKGEGGQTVPPDAGCRKCGKCHACPIVKEGAKFFSTNTKKCYRIKQKVNCKSDYVIYLGTCVRCKGQYVGKTSREFRKRHSGHKQEIKKDYGGLGHHYGGQGGCTYEHVSIQIIEQVELGNDAMLAKRELYWQNQLRCFVENGGNAHCYRKEY